MLLDAEFWQTMLRYIQQNMIIVYVAIGTIIGSIVSYIIFNKGDKK